MKTIVKRHKKRLSLVRTLALMLAGSLVFAGCSSSSSSSSTTTKSSTSGTTAAVADYQQLLSQLETPPTSSVSLSETGSTLLYPLFSSSWAPMYEKSYPNISITSQSTGSGTGIAQAAAGTVNIGGSDAYLSKAQATQYPNLLNIPLAISAQEVVYNLPGVSGNLKLNGKVLSLIYQGKITTWNDPQIKDINPGVNLPSTPIVALHRSDGSGDTFIFTQFLAFSDTNGWGQSIAYGTSVTWPAISNALAENGNGGMVSGCAKTVGCVAYVGVSYAQQVQQNNLGEAMLANKSGNYLLPNQQTIQTEVNSFSNQVPPNQSISLVFGPAPQGYPIVNYEYAVVSKTQPNATTAQAIKAFLAWCMDPAHGNSAQVLNTVNFVALPAISLKQSLEQLSQIS